MANHKKQPHRFWTIVDGRAIPIAKPETELGPPINWAAKRRMARHVDPPPTRGPRLANAIRMTDCSAYGGEVAMHIGEGIAVEADGFAAAGFKKTGIENKGTFRGRRIRIK